MSTESLLLTAIPVAILLGGLLYASIADWRTREVTDSLWVILGALGAAIGVAVAAPNGWVPTLLWVLVSILVLEHLLPWDVRLEAVHRALPGVVELAFYGVTLLLLVLAGASLGVGPTGVSIPVIAVFITVVLARILFETGVLYGGADAKALMVAGILVPILAATLFAIPTSAADLLAVFPFSVTVLMNAALLSIAIPLALAVRNLRRREFRFPQGFTGYTIPVRELPRRFVWLRDPTFSRELTEEERNIETAEEDRALRERQMHELETQGATRVWVTPQIPFVLPLAVGALAAVLLGNLLFDLLALL